MVGRERETKRNRGRKRDKDKHMGETNKPKSKSGR